MSKGDTVTVVTRTGQVESMTVYTAGRKVTVTEPSPRARHPWIVVEEVTRFGRPTGTRIRIRPDDVAMIREVRLDETPAKPKTRIGKMLAMNLAREVPGVKSNTRPILDAEIAVEPV